MKIKLHNSLGKFYGDSYIFDDKIFLHLPDNIICLYYQIDDRFCFLMFYSNTKKFEKEYGFGKNDKDPNLSWWRRSPWKWKEMSR